MSSPPFYTQYSRLREAGQVAGRKKAASCGAAGKEVRTVKMEKYRAKRDLILQELIDFLKEKELTYGQARITLEDARSWLERASSKQQI